MTSDHGGHGTMDLIKNVKGMFSKPIFKSSMAEVEHRHEEQSGLNGFVSNSTTASTQTNEEKLLPLKKIGEVAQQLAEDIVKVAMSDSEPSCPNKYCKVMRRTVNELLTKHEILFSGMIEKLDITQENGQETFRKTADEIFTDNVVNWGRIVAVFAFGARIIQHFKEKNITTHHADVSEFLGTYVTKKLGPWIHKNGGWDEFTTFFANEDDTSDSIWRGLVVTAIGLGALASWVAVR